MWHKNNGNFSTELYQLYALVLHLIADESDVFYYSPGKADCNLHNLQIRLSNHPQFVWNTEVPYGLLRNQGKSDMYVMACLKDFNMERLKGLTTSLKGFKQARILIELINYENTVKDSLAMEILMYFHQQNMLNVALYFYPTVDYFNLYSFEAFPRFKILKHCITKELQLFPNQIDNLRGYALRVMHDYSEPNTILYTDSSGHKRLTGFMWRFIETFAWKHNSQINAMHPTWSASRLLSEPHMLDLTRNGTIDIGLITEQMSNKYTKRYLQYAYPVLLGSWCTMLPLERHIEGKEIFEQVWKVSLFPLLLMLVTFLIMNKGLRFFLIPNWIRNCWHCLGLAPRLSSQFFICLTLAQLFYLTVKRPKLPTIESFDDLIASNIQIFIMRAEFDLLENDFRARYAEAFRLTSNLSEFFRMRNSFNTSYAYSIATNKWVILEEQQRHFKRPMFRYSDLCFCENRPQSFVLDEDSIYYDALKLFTMRMEQSGIMQHWVHLSLYDMIRTGRMDLRDYSTFHPTLSISMEDLQLTWRCYGVGLLLALFAFFVEFLWFYVNVCLDMV